MQPNKYRRKGIMGKILSKSSAVGWTQVIHFTSARGFDEPHGHNNRLPVIHFADARSFDEAQPIGPNSGVPDPNESVASRRRF